MAERSGWQAVFTQWPNSITKKGIITTTLGENIPFKGFMISGNALLLERSNPDALGARFIIIEFPSISMMKYVDPLNTANFAEMGFEGKLSV